MPKSVSKSAYSAGAREERAVIRRYLRRQIKSCDAGNYMNEADALIQALKFVLTRESRYGKRKGGL